MISQGLHSRERATNWRGETDYEINNNYLFLFKNVNVKYKLGVG